MVSLYDDFYGLFRHIESLSVDKPKAAICYFMDFTKIRPLKQSLMLLDKNFNDFYQYPVYLFYDPLQPFDIKVFDIVRKSTRSQVQFYAVPDYRAVEFNTNLVPKDVELSCDDQRYHTIATARLTEFWYRKFFNNPSVQDLEYFMRLDTYSAFMTPVKYDMLRWMKAKNISYAFREYTYEGNCFKEGLLGHFSIYALSHDIYGGYLAAYARQRSVNDRIVKYNYRNDQYSLRKVASMELNGWMYNTGIEMSKLSLWTTEKYRDLSTSVSVMGYAYDRGWTLEALRTLSLSLIRDFTSNYFIYQFTDFVSIQGKFIKNNYMFQVIIAIVSSSLISLVFMIFYTLARLNLIHNVVIYPYTENGVLIFRDNSTKWGRMTTRTMTVLIISGGYYLILLVLSFIYTFQVSSMRSGTTK
ncbi:hypothetical protein MP638_002947 [Amoeboaphelidium occidentale]|nr:hypothetical protein MP638_002947 [Amoeboaphelidium occidentale]